jgi:hypothetical protein
MTIKPVLVPDHDAASLRKLMDHFTAASTGPTRQQLTESRAAVTAAQKTINEGFMDTVKQAFNDCVVGYPQGTSEGQFIQGWARAIRAETGRDIPLEKLTQLYQDYAERSDELMQSHGTTNESEHEHDHDEEGETCPECDGAGCPECYGEEDRDRAYDRARGMERESAGMAEMWGNPYDDDKVDAINAANPPKRSTPYTPPSTPAKHHTYDRKSVASNISGKDSAAYDRFTGRDKDMAEGTGQQLNIQQLATISDEALDNAYHYGRSTPGNTFGWQANLKSAAYAKQMIDQGVTDIEAISDAIHKGWNVTARAFVQNPEQFSDTEKLRAAGKLEAKLQQREKLMNIGYAQLPDEEQEKDRVVARALLQALKGQQGMAEAGRPDVMRHKGDTTVKVVKRGGRPIGEIGIDAEASEGNGPYYVKLYDGSYDAVGFDTAAEALAELKYAISEGLAEVLGTSPDRLMARTGMNLPHKFPRTGQTNLGNIPGTNLPDSSEQTKKYGQERRANRPDNLKAAIRGQSAIQRRSLENF